jgi:UV DNA damage repair endonuclease
METTRNGIVIKLIDIPIVKESSLARRVCDKIKASLHLGYNLFVIELSDRDMEISTEINPAEKERFLYFLEDLNIRIAFYIRSKNYIVSTDSNSKRKAKQEITKVGKFIEEIDASRFDIPLICHIGGAKGNRKKSMLEFCKFFEGLPWRTQKQICLINDDKPSLFSVKDLLSIPYIENKIPIVFRASSHKTNQGGLTYKESLFLAASTWAERSNPIMFYCPSSDEERIGIKDLNPYNLIVDVAFDNNLPEPVKN